ncbi:hypothetical protein [Nocardioides hwasunensis]|uniref:Uncharacterized protein n=1 Tax=Nocardioides hwasunensis TaxID=397258 RepID=A0ABR8MNB3_9ACTN|nr:hypothetical protein [Nocardioides hwasunensis]MBD3916521.1 hypothetical protein [Nocardioides hwasunensis]
MENAAAVLSEESRVLAGVLLLSLVTVETGGLHLLRIVRGRSAVTPFQEKFARAGHAHAAVLLVLALVCQVLADNTAQTGVLDWFSRSGVAVSALLMPGGFFLSSMGAGRTEPNRLIVMVFAGALLLALSLVSLGVGLLVA